jgi:hypothetical protein
MTTYNEQVYAGMPFQYKIVKDRYWDKVVSKSITVDTVDDVTLEPYDGVTITQDGSILTVSSGLLPNGNSYAGYKGVTAPAGKSYLAIDSSRVYDGFTAIGTPLITGSGILHDIASNATFKTTFYNQSYFWEICVAVHTPETFVGQSYLFGNVSTNRATPQLCTDSEGHLMLYLASSTSSWDIANGVVSEQALAADTDCVVKLSWNGTNYIVTVNDAEYINIASEQVQYSTNSEQLALGYDSGNGVWTGTIDLNQTYISINGEKKQTYTDYSEILPGALTDDDGTMQDWNCFYDGETEFNKAQSMSGKVWLGHKVIESHVTNPFPAVNFTQVGEVTYSGNAATFTDGNYLVADKKLPNVSFFPQNFDFTAKITPKTPSGYNTVFRNATTNVFFGLYGAAWCVYSGSRTTGGTATADTAYWIKVRSIYDSETSSYTSTLYVLPDNGSYTLETLPALAEWEQAVQVAANVFMSEENFWLSNDGNASFNGDMQLDQIELKTGGVPASGTEIDWVSYWKPLDTSVVTA